MNLINLNQWKSSKSRDLKCPECNGKVLETSQITENDELILIHFCTECDYLNVSA